MRPFKEQFTLRGVVTGLLGCVIITASSVYVALKLGMLPWPIFFVVLLALFVLKAFARVSRRATNINEANVSATIMSAGAMVAGGLAFTIPGIYILMPAAEVPLATVVLCALCGVALGCICTSLVRKHFIEDSKLPYPIGTGAAQTLEAGDKGGRKALLLFSSVGLAGVFAVVRDALGAVPQMLFDWVKIPGVAFGVYFSPMAIATGFMIGPLAALVWVLGGLFGNFVLVSGGVAVGLWDLAAALDIRKSLGIGVMIGCGLGIIFKVVLPRVRQMFAPLFTREKGSAIVPMRWAPFVLAAVVLVLSFVVGLGLLPSLLLVLLTWVVVTMAAQSTGQAGLNPMEVFGVIVLLIIALICQTGGIEAFLVTAVATVACGFVGDLMNDFKAGHLLKSDPKAQFIGEALGGVVGAVVGALIIAALVAAYGPESFGAGKEFVSAQADVVASMVGGIPHLPAFVIGIVAGTALYLVGAPVITLGLGIYLPFYLSLTIAVGAAVRFVIGLVAPQWSKGEDGIIIASGLLGGESIAGVILALIVIASGLTAL
ncbi:MAG: OPT/YSL family transporter [Coriobacteriales bacterium]|jgi:putative OPT family oligopeptide transporter|nr:OPT/YSL family transporter [Coriobacteriales bacterium]